MVLTYDSLQRSTICLGQTTKKGQNHKGNLKRWIYLKSIETNVGTYIYICRFTYQEGVTFILLTLGIRTLQAD